MDYLKNLDDVIKEGKQKNTGEILSENNLIIEKIRSVFKFCYLYPEFHYIQSRKIVKCALCAQEPEHDMSEPYMVETSENVPEIFYHEGSEKFASIALLSKYFQNLTLP